MEPRQLDDALNQQIVDSVGGLKFMTELVKVYGPAHSARFFGWCVMLGAAMREGDTKKDAVERLATFGFSRATGYRMVAQIEEFKEHLAKEVLPPSASLTLYDTVQKVKAEGLSQINN